MHIHEIVRGEEWVVARQALVEELTRLRDQLYADPCDVPWVRAASFACNTSNGFLDGLFGGPEHSAHGWSALFDKLEGYLRAMN